MRSYLDNKIQRLRKKMKSAKGNIKIYFENIYKNWFELNHIMSLTFASKIQIAQQL